MLEASSDNAADNVSKDLELSTTATVEETDVSVYALHECEVEIMNKDYTMAAFKHLAHNYNDLLSKYKLVEPDAPEDYVRPTSLEDTNTNTHADIQAINIVDDHAHIEVASYVDAQRAMTNLNKTPLKSNVMKVEKSKFDTVIVSPANKENKTGAIYRTMHYKNLHKRIDRTKNIPPTSSIYVTNLP
ncbi:uncharacterized protein LOC127749943 [Frankliniella occidentalis]|uniref:Uncharacterized protein LOC127749943 n=1 Tax=Frankliniella occidentalis TaxID=133901 RepID=A0A9C6UE00_FRAOC|nr:uncharacterized protein LOC127749943 [Frankliniella occidentalis]